MRRLLQCTASLCEISLLSDAVTCTDLLINKFSFDCCVHYYINALNGMINWTCCMIPECSAPPLLEQQHCYLRLCCGTVPWDTYVLYSCNGQQICNGIFVFVSSCVLFLRQSLCLGQPLRYAQTGKTPICQK